MIKCDFKIISGTRQFINDVFLGASKIFSKKGAAFEMIFKLNHGLKKIG